MTPANRFEYYLVFVDFYAQQGWTSLDQPLEPGLSSVFTAMVVFPTTVTTMVVKWLNAAFNMKVEIGINKVLK